MPTLKELSDLIIREAITVACCAWIAAAVGLCVWLFFGGVDAVMIGRGF